MKLFTEGLHQILKKAEEVKVNNHLKYIGTEVILYSILLTQKCDACAYLNEFGANKANYFPHFRKTFRNLIVETYTPNAYSALYTAKDISRSFKLNYVSTEHLLMAILSINDCYGVKILRALGVDVTSLYTFIYTNLKNRTLNLKSEVKTNNEISANISSDKNTIKQNVLNSTILESVTTNHNENASELDLS
ncbi:MAG: hypothetical protein J6Q38_02045, partial [Clostridia bacterium]|nr:hypothetical protein [Clostridia bacterium]